MPGILISRPNLHPTHDMSMAQSYERLEEFLDNHQYVTRFTVDDDHHDMGLLCAHLPQERVHATSVRLNRTLISNFMRSHGFECRNVEGSTVIECIRPTQQQ